MEIWKIHRKIAIDFIKEQGLDKDKNVLAIVFLGSIGRKLGDEFSDIDISLIVSKKFDAERYGLRIPYLGDVKYKGYLVDVYIEEIDKFCKLDWDMGTKWTYKYSEIYIDKANIKEIITEKTNLKEEEWKYLEMEGIVQSKYFGVYLPKKWLSRFGGHIINSNMNLYKGIKFLYQAIYAYNRELIPADPWYFFWAKYKNFREPIEINYLEHYIEEILEIKNINEKIKKFENLLDELIPKFEKHLKISYEEMERII
jgi:hypothetical protein